MNYRTPKYERAKSAPASSTFQPLVDFTPKPETIYFARLSIMLFDVTQDALRAYMKTLFGETDEDFTNFIRSKCNDLIKRVESQNKKKKLTLFKHEAKLFFPTANDTVSYADLDITLMYKFLRHLDHEKVDKNDTSKWDKEPHDGDKSILAAIERIRIIRNTFVAHVNSTLVNKVTFDDTFKKLRFSVKVIDEEIGTGQDHATLLDQIKDMDIDAETVAHQRELAKEIDNLHREKEEWTTAAEHNGKLQRNTNPSINLQGDIFTFL